VNTKIVIKYRISITDETIRRFCNEHKQPNMVNVKSKVSEHEGCNKQPCFNNEWNKRKILCRTQATRNGWCYIKCCEYEGCNKRSYSITQMKQVEDFVKNIKEHDMVDVNTKGVFMNGVIHL
jgi:hypothetical protein